MTKKKPMPARARRVSGKMAVAARIAHQHQIRETAAASPILSPALAEALGEWSQVTDTVAQLNDEVAVAEQSLRTLRGRLHIELARFTLIEGVFASGVDHASQGDPEKIRSLGYSALIERSAGPLRLAPPEALRAFSGKQAGVVELAWKPAAGANSYSLQTSADPAIEGSWVNRTPSARSRASVAGLQAGSPTWFRVATLGASGQSAWSEPGAATPR